MLWSDKVQIIHIDADGNERAEHVDLRDNRTREELREEDRLMREAIARSAERRRVRMQEDHAELEAERRAKLTIGHRPDGRGKVKEATYDPSL